MRALVSKSACAALAVVATLGASVAAYADDPTFTYGKYEEKKTVEWVATASAGLLLTTGNANQLSFNAAGMAMRNDGHNKLQLDVNGAYARSTVLSGAPADGSTTISSGSDIKRTTSTSTALWNAKLRYDRFFTPNNLGYVAGFAWGNEPAGKRVVGGVQAGYSRQLFKNDMHLIVAEAGYDFSAESLAGVNANGVHPLYELHSLRFFVGYTLSASKDTILQFNLEYLGNMNPFDGPYPDPTRSSGLGRIKSFQDSRVNGQASITTRIWKKLAFRFSFTAKYDNVPAPLPAISGFTFAKGFVPAAQKLDTLSDASLVVTFL